MNRILMIIIASICFNLSTAQSSINNYKYVIVEKQFHFQGEENQYNLNEMVRFNFRKYGFKAIIEGEEFPADLKANYCLALQSEVRARGTFKTVATIVLKDCENNEVFISDEGVTKEKKYDRLYYIAIGKAFESFKNINYAYKPSQDVIDKGTSEETTEVVEEAKKEIQELKAEIKELKEKNESKSLVEEIEPEAKQKVITQEVDVVEVQAEAPKSNWYDALEVYKQDDVTYYKKSGYGGIYFVNQKDEVVFKLQNATRPNVFILTVGNYQGVAFYDKDMKDYTLQYYNENRELETKILKPN